MKTLNLTPNPAPVASSSGAAPAEMAWPGEENGARRYRGQDRDERERARLAREQAAAAATAPGGEEQQRAQFICPLSLKEMNGVMPFVYIRTCGCVFSQGGLKAVRSTTSDSPPPTSTPPSKTEESAKEAEATTDSEAYSLCPHCATKFLPKSDIVTINPSPQEEEAMFARMLAARAAEPRKSKKRKAKDTTSAQAEDSEPASKKSKEASHASIDRALLSSLAMEEAKRKAGMSEAVKSLYSGGRPGVKETFMTMNTFTRVGPFFLYPFRLCPNTGLFFQYA